MLKVGCVIDLDGLARTDILAVHTEIRGMIEVQVKTVHLIALKPTEMAPVGLPGWLREGAGDERIGLSLRHCWRDSLPIWTDEPAIEAATL